MGPTQRAEGEQRPLRAPERSVARPHAVRGQGKVGCFLWLLAAFIAGMVAFKMIPVKVKTAELHDFMEDRAKWSQRATAEGIKKDILNKANELALPVDEKGIQVQLSRERVRMDVAYTVPVEFPGYTYQWRFHHLVDRPIFIF